MSVLLCVLGVVLSDVARRVGDRHRTSCWASG